MPRNTSGLKRGGSPGRPKGVLNKTTRDMQEFAREFLSDPDGVEALRQQYRSGTLPPAIWQTLAYYGHGKPKDTLDLRTTPPLMVVDELTAADVDAMTRDRES